MEVYILLEEVFGTDERYTEVLGTYTTQEKAFEELKKTINDNIKYCNFVLDEQNDCKPEVLKNHTIIFYDYQENWNNYIEYIIIKKEVL